MLDAGLDARLWLLDSLLAWLSIVAGYYCHSVSVCFCFYFHTRYIVGSLLHIWRTRVNYLWTGSNETQTKLRQTRSRRTQRLRSPHPSDIAYFCFSIRGRRKREMERGGMALDARYARLLLTLAHTCSRFCLRFGRGSFMPIPIPNPPVLVLKSVVNSPSQQVTPRPTFLTRD